MKEKCFFCDSEEDVILHNVGIALGMGGEDYSFCKKCLLKMSAAEFWGRFFDKVRPEDKERYRNESPFDLYEL